MCIQFNHVDFSFYGSAMAVVAGRSLNGKDVTGSLVYTDEQGEEQSIPFTFKAGEGEEYELSSENFWRQTVAAKGITGEQNLKVIFDPGTSFDFEALTFLSSPLPTLEGLLEQASQVEEYASVRPLLYTPESWAAFAQALEDARKVDLKDDVAVLTACEALQTALDGLEETGKSRSAYDTIYAWDYDSVTGTVHLEREEPNQVVGGFDKGELLHFDGVDFGSLGAAQISVVAANGRSDSESEPIATLRFYLSEEKTEYADVTVEQTGGWTASADQTFTAEVDSTVFRGVKDVTVELLEGAVAFHSFGFTQSQEEPGDKTLLQKTYDYALTLSTDGVVGSAAAYFEKVLAEAGRVLADPNATQAQVNAAWDALLEGIWGLGLVQGDKTMLEQLIAKADDMVANADKYMTDNWQQLVDALANAKDVYADGDAMDQDIQPVAEDLLSAILAQRFKADKSILEDLIGKAEGMDLSGYTTQSVEVFRTALAQAQAVLADETLAEDDQATVDAAVEQLTQAMNGLTAEGTPEATDKPETTDKPEVTDKPQATQKPENNVPQTGDHSQITLWVTMMGLCAVSALTVVAVKGRRKAK